MFDRSWHISIPGQAASSFQEMEEFKALLQLAIVEAQLVWQRFNVMLAANGFLLALLGVHIAKVMEDMTKNASGEVAWPWVWLTVIGSIFGLALCFTWRAVTKCGWSLEHKWAEEAKKHKWQHFTNPYQLYTDWCRENGCGEGWNDLIARHARWVIGLFVIVYLLAFSFGAWQMQRC